MTRERIEGMREVILPFVKKRLLETNYEGLGKSDAEEFTRDFNEILDLATKALEQETVSKESYDHEYYLRKEFELKIDKLQRQFEKIRAEIENHCGLAKENHCKYCSYCNNVMGVREILEIIDKNKAETEDT